MENKEKRIVTFDELFVSCVRKEMISYKERREAYEAEIAKKGYRLRRGGFERINWNADYIAEQYKLCLEKKCKEPATVRNLICVIGDSAALRLKAILEDYEKKQQEQEKQEKK